MSDAPFALAGLTGAEIDALLRDGTSPAVLKGIPSQALEAVYAECYDDLTQGRFEPGLERAAWLLRQEPWDRRFHMAYAYALHQLGQYETAGRFYTLAFEMDLSDPVCALRLGECLAGLEDLDGAHEMFEVAVLLSWGSPDHEPWRELAQDYLDRLSHLRG